MRRLVGLLVVIWLAIGVVAVGQRGYFCSSPQNCAGVATVAVTVVAGPMNYLGVNPQGQVPFAAALGLNLYWLPVLFASIGAMVIEDLRSLPLAAESALRQQDRPLSPS